MAESVSSSKLGPPSVRNAVRALLFVCLVMPIGILTPLPLNGRIFFATFDLAHAPSFCLLTLLVFSAVPAARDPDRFRLRLLLWFAVGLVASGLELAQGFTHRSVSFRDAQANLVGATAGLLLFEGLIRVRWRRTFLLAGIATLLFAVAPALSMLYDIYRQVQQFPLLASFESKLEFTRWGPDWTQVRISDKHVSAGEHSAELPLIPGEMAILLMNDLPGEWTKYSAVEFDVYIESPAEQEELIIKVSDFKSRDEKESQTQFILHLETNAPHHIRLSMNDIRDKPTQRSLEIQDLKQFQFMVWRPRAAGSVYLDHLRLTDSKSPE